MSKADHLAKARDYIAIAESGDAKREAYKAAAEEIAAHKEETGDSNKAIARVLQQAPTRIDKMVQWRDSGYEAPSPWHHTGKDEGAARSHAKRVLREADGEAVEQIVRDLPTEKVERLVHTAANELNERHRPIRHGAPVRKSLFQRFADHCFTGWKLQDEMQDTPAPVGDEAVRFRAIADANLAFAQAVMHWLDTGEFNDEVARLLDEVSS